MIVYGSAMSAQEGVGLYLEISWRQDRIVEDGPAMDLKVYFSERRRQRRSRGMTPAIDLREPLCFVMVIGKSHECKCEPDGWLKEQNKCIRVSAPVRSINGKMLHFLYTIGIEYETDVLEAGTVR